MILAAFRVVQACCVDYRHRTNCSVVLLSHSQHIPGNIPKEDVRLYRKD